MAWRIISVPELQREADCVDEEWPRNLSEPMPTAEFVNANA